MHITSLTESLLDDVAALVAARYAELRRSVPLLPPTYETPAVFLPRLAGMIAEHPGVAAFEGGKLAGFLTGWCVPSMRGERGVYSPEWANTTSGDDRRILQGLYTELAGRWVTEGYVEHAVSVFAHDRPGLEGWRSLGFGNFVTDAVRSLDPVAGPLADVEVQLAELEDFDAIARLEEGLQDYLRGAPTFLPLEPDADHADMRAFMENPATATFLARQDEKPVGYLRFQPASQNACTVIRDEATASITGAYTVEEARGGGIARALLNAGLAWARDRGYRRCAVDFEAMNPLGSAFWLRHFRPVVFSLQRHINAAASRQH